MLRELSHLSTPGTLTTWLNHYSLQVCKKAGIPLHEFDVVGIDGVLLRIFLLGRVKRSSADCVIPEILRTSLLSVGLVGGSPIESTAHLNALKEKYPKTEFKWSISGYENNLTFEIFKQYESSPVDLIVLGLGSPLQENIALDLKSLNVSSSILTCGGWLDQVTHPGYYPRWAYPLRLNWLVRLSREPRRLWKRYTTWVWAFLCSWNELRKYLSTSQITSIKFH